MVILSVDYGKARTGIAVCDKGEMIASPVCTINEYNMDNLAKKIREYTESYHAELIVLGLPKNMDGSEGESAENVRVFSGLLEKETGLPVVLRDERCTTVIAHQYLNATDTRGKKRKKVVDTVAAVIILEDYLNYRRNNP